MYSTVLQYCGVQTLATEKQVDALIGITIAYLGYLSPQWAA